MNDYGSDPFFDNVDRQSALELGMTCDHEGEDFFVSLLQRAEQDRLMQQQVKKHGLDYGIDIVATSEPGTKAGGVSTDGKFARAQVLVLPGMAVQKKPDKDSTKRLRKAMGLA